MSVVVPSYSAKSHPLQGDDDERDINRSDPSSRAVIPVPGLRFLKKFFRAYKKEVPARVGRGAQEKVIGELKNGFAFAAIPTQTYCANTAWQKLNVLAHNLMTSFQLATTARERPRSLKRTGLYVLRNVATLRFEWLSKAARLLRPGGTPVLRLAANDATQHAYEEIQRALDKAA